MAKACGLRIGPRRFELVVIDGSPKKPKVVSILAGEIPPDEEDPLGAAAFALKSAIKTHRLSMDNVGLVIESRSAAFRSVTLPVTGDAKIEDVLKFEVESQLPQFSIDEVVVDFYTKETTGDSSTLLVTAVPKADIHGALELCEQAGIEPLEIELETSALVNSAAHAELCGPEEALILVHVGEESTAVAVIDGGKVREMRIIQTGALSYTPHGVLPPEQDENENEGESKDTEEPEGPQPIERADAVVSRIRRELARTVSAARTVNEVVGVRVCGFELPGMVEDDILGLPVESFDAYEVDTFEGDVHVEYRSAAVAYGCALRQLGGGIMRASLRREELKFTGTLERIELPLAVMFLLITTFLGVWFMFQGKRRAQVDSDLYFLLKSSSNFMIGDPRKGNPGNLEYPSERIVKYVNATIGGGGGKSANAFKSDPYRNRYEQFLQLRKLLNSDQKDLQQRLGNDAELQQPQSALKALTLVLDQLAQADKRYGRVSMRDLSSDFRSSARDGGYVEVVLRMSFFAETSGQATENYERFFRDLKSKPWYVEHSSGSSDPITGPESGTHLSSVKIKVDLTKAGEVKS